ncbi:hypothetical protein ABK040_011787 [Willaertia magna]
MTNNNNHTTTNANNNNNNLRKINPNDINLIEEIGSGGYGKVYKAKWYGEGGGILVAVKEMIIYNPSGNNNRLFSSVSSPSLFSSSSSNHGNFNNKEYNKEFNNNFEFNKKVNERLQQYKKIKNLNEQDFTKKNEKLLKMVENELTLLHNLQHPNIITIYGYYEFNDILGIVMELLDENCNGKLITNNLNEKLNWKQKFTIFEQTIKGIHFLHCQDPQILHRDIKSHNILLKKKIKIIQQSQQQYKSIASSPSLLYFKNHHHHTNNNHVINHYNTTNNHHVTNHVLYEINYDAILCDFGLCRTKSLSQSKIKTKNDRVGTVRWCAPECTQREPEYSIKSDIFSLGMFLYELIVEKIPFEELDSDIQVIYMIRIEQQRPLIPVRLQNTFPAFFKELMEMCWKQNPKERPNTFELLELLERNRESWWENCCQLDSFNEYNNSFLVKATLSQLSLQQQSLQLQNSLQQQSTGGISSGNFKKEDIYGNNNKKITLEEKINLVKQKRKGSDPNNNNNTIVNNNNNTVNNNNTIVNYVNNNNNDMTTDLIERKSLEKKKREEENKEDYNYENHNNNNN